MKGRFCILIFLVIIMMGLFFPEKSTRASGDAEVIPVRAAAEALGGSVQWIKEERALKVRLGSRKWEIVLGSSLSALNEKDFVLVQPAGMNAENMVCVPLQSFNGALGVRMEFREGQWMPGREDITGLGMYWMRLMQLGDYDKARSMMNASLADLFPDEALEHYKDSLDETYGSWILLKADFQENDVHKNAILIYQTPRGQSFRMELRFDKGGRLDDLALLRNTSDTYTSPSYDQPGEYVEKKVTVGTKSLPLPGTLTIPEQSVGKLPAVVLVHGSGPSDEDESSGGGKMFRDIAVGLANEGIAVLRYSKRTYEYPNRSLTPNFTVQEETIEDSLSAVKLLQQDERIDSSRIYVLGHSQGGMLVPKILEEDHDDAISGAMLLSAPSGSLEDLMLQQYKGILQRAVDNNETGAELERKRAKVDTWQNAVDMLHDDEYSKEQLPALFPLPSAYWWYDIRRYSGPMIARNQHVPLLILQGENDVQVPLSSLKVWKQALDTRTDVKYKSYPGLNHMYALYDQPSTGDEYRIAANVPGAVIKDLADWIHLAAK
ncbi:alpha/beta fold hydrolase [Paenibacillus dokdonensis]|uniref:Alpha/beta fold hydrolase n=1 Tax=Paenibacillus dokdonensis TaxID=2567944 RepID=A0ABU6GPZ5_9BACL|nr:alpha/beta fold hydrolase [Paenibacillus dokdonensis]MEC0241788.1 alpha/beta fold hydrolase [Paenibacillus dokdonensis]